MNKRRRFKAKAQQLARRKAGNWLCVMAQRAKHWQEEMRARYGWAAPKEG